MQDQRMNHTHKQTIYFARSSAYFALSTNTLPKYISSSSVCLSLDGSTELIPYLLNGK